MSMKKTTALVFDHRNRTKEGHKGQIEVRVIVNRKSYYFGTGIKVYRSEFVAGRIVNCAGADKLNERVAIIYNKVMELVNHSIATNLPLDAEFVRRKVWEVAEKKADNVLLEWIHQQIPLLDIKEGTRKHYYPLENRLKEWGKMLTWEDVTTEKIYEFDAWLHGIYKPISETALMAGVKPELISNAGVFNYHKTLKTLLRRARKMGKISSNPYDLLVGEFKRGETENTEFLTEDEMAKIRELSLERGSTLDISRDLFVFQMYTGMSYSDAEAFDFKKYKKIEGMWRYVGPRIKTGVQYVSELLPPVLEVLKKYHGTVPQVNNSDYNRRLKEIQRMTGIETRLHSHLARHTFATWMLSNDVKLENVKKMLGHKSIVTTQRYAKVLAQNVHDDYKMMSCKLECK